MKKMMKKALFAVMLVLSAGFLSLKPVDPVPSALSGLAAPLKIDLTAAADNWLKTVAEFDFKDEYYRSNPEANYLYYAINNLGKNLDEKIRETGYKDEEDCEKRNDTSSDCYLRSFRNMVMYPIYRSPVLRETAYNWLLPGWRQTVSVMDEPRKLLLAKIVNHMIEYTAEFDYQKELAFYKSCKGENEYLFVSEYPVVNGEEDYDSDNTNPYRRGEAWVFRRVHKKHMTIKEINQWLSRIKKDLSLPEADENTVFYAKKGETYYTSGNKKIDNKNYAGAIEDFSKGIEAFRNSVFGLTSSDAGAFNKMATARIELEDYKNAIADLNEAIQLHPECAECYYNRGYAYYRLTGSSYNELAINDFTKALELDPKNELAYVYRAEIKYSLKDYAEAEKDYSNYLILAKSDFTYYRRGSCRFYLENYKGAVEDFTQAIDLYEVYKERISDYKRKKEFYSDRGYANYFLGYYHQAFIDLKNACLLDSTDFMIWYRLGLVESALKEYSEAINDYDVSIKLNNRFSLSYYHRALARSELKDYPGALADYNKSIEIDPENSRFYAGLSLYYSLMNSYPLAIETAKKGLNINPDYPELLGNLGYYYLEGKDTKPAKECLLKSIELKKENIDVILGLSVCCFLSKDKANAAKYFAEAKRIKPELAKGLEGIAKLETEGYVYSDKFKMQFEKMFKKLK